MNRKNNTSPSGEKVNVDIAEMTVSGAPENKVGIPGGPLASRILIFVTLKSNRENRSSSAAEKPPLIEMA